MVSTILNKDQIYSLLSAIPDPEIPVINICEMGIIRDVVPQENSCKVIITPTYTGCPAMKLIEDQVRQVLNDNGIEKVEVEMVYKPAWTTDWMTKETKEKLRKYGISPPVSSSCNKLVSAVGHAIHCPICNSQNTSVISKFGSTACKALYRCNNCAEPFEYFKCI